MKSLVTSETLLAYPDHNILFHIETDASDLQLGAVIKQNGKPVAFYTRKLTPAQHNYSTIEKELLSIIETFCEFHLMLLGSNIHVYTDHKNLTHKLSQYVTQHVLCWRLLLEEYNPTFHDLKGPDNVLADALERLPSSIVTPFLLLTLPLQQNFLLLPHLRKSQKPEHISIIWNWPSAWPRCHCPRDSPLGPTMMLFLTFITIACYFTMTLTHKRISPFISPPYIITNNVTPGYRMPLNMTTISIHNALVPSTLFVTVLCQLRSPLIGRSPFPPTCLDPLSIGTTRPSPMPLAWTALKR